MDSLCLEAKLKIGKFIESFEKNSTEQLTTQFTLEQLDTLDCVEDALLIGFNETSASTSLQDQFDQLTLKMWRNIIYPQIDYIRRQLTTSKDEEIRRNLAYQLDTIILGHLGRISNLIACFTEGKRDLFDSETFLNEEFDFKQKKILVRLLTISGDLIRYRCSNNNIFGSYDQFQSAKEFYELGHRIDPADGSIFNQLAVIESLSPNKSVPMMIYLYSRALGSQEPFPIAKENLNRLLKKFGSLFNGLLCILEGEEMDDFVIVELDKMFKNYPGEEHLLYASALALGSYLNVTIPKVNNYNNIEMSILNGDAFIKYDYKFNLNFLSTLIGSSFISESIQEEILKIFSNQNEA